MRPSSSQLKIEVAVSLIARTNHERDLAVNVTIRLAASRFSLRLVISRVRLRDYLPVSV
jgi:hypothetical protein